MIDLHQLRKDLIQIRKLQEILVRLRCKSEKITSVLSDDIKTRSVEQDKTAIIVADIVDTENNIANIQNSVLSRINDFENAISCLDEVEKLIIRLRYIRCKNWSEIEDTIGYSRCHLDRKHKAILVKLKDETL